MVAFQANQLPNPLVEISVPGHPPHSVSAKHSVNPRWETAEPASYKRLSSDSRVTVRMYDRKGRNHMSLLGENTISCSRLKGDKPMYIWLPLQPSMKSRSMLGFRKRRAMPTLDADVEEAPELQVCLQSYDAQPRTLRLWEQGFMVAPKNVYLSSRRLVQQTSLVQ